MEARQMDERSVALEGESDETGHRADGRPMLAGLHVREDDLEPATGLHLVTKVLRVCSVIILVLAVVQFAAWWLDRPPGNAGLGLLVGDTVRLVVLTGLLWAAGDLATLGVKTHYDVRASRILLARQTYMMRQMGVSSGELPQVPRTGDRRESEVP
jgi:hypothetical protein